MNNTALKRNGKILYGRFFCYFFPSVIGAVAMALNEFVDSMVVARLIGSNAMAIVNIGSPIMCLIVALNVLWGTGGSILYTASIGKGDRNNGNTAFSAAIAAGVISAIVLALFGVFFAKQMAVFLCKGNPLFVEASIPYLKVLCLSSLLSVPVLCLSFFLPVLGKPGIATALTVIANVVNLCMDIVFIKYAELGVTGAALATFSGYVAAALFLVIWAKITSFSFPHFSLKKVRQLLASIPSVASQGMSESLTQLSYGVLMAYCNVLAVKTGGENGLVALSLCFQVASMTAILLCSILGALPIFAMLNSQKDFSGIKIFFGRLTLFTLLSMGIFQLVLYANIPSVLSMYNISGSQLESLCVHGLKIYMLHFTLRALAILYKSAMNIMGHKRLAVAISVVDGFGGIILVSMVLSYFFGFDGLLWTFVLVPALILLFVPVCALVMNKKYGTRGILSSESDDFIFNVTVRNENDDISQSSMQIASKLRQFVSEKMVGKISLVLEEMLVYEKSKYREHVPIDVMVRLDEEKKDVMLTVRAVGKSFTPLVECENDIWENTLLLKKLASSIENDYIMGMNAMRISVHIDCEQ